MNIAKRRRSKLIATLRKSLPSSTRLTQMPCESLRRRMVARGNRKEKLLRQHHQQQRHHQRRQLLKRQERQPRLEIRKSFCSWFESRWSLAMITVQRGKVGAATGPALISRIWTSFPNHTRRPCPQRPSSLHILLLPPLLFSFHLLQVNIPSP